MSDNVKELAGKVAIVTGAAAGIGAETAKLLAEKGANVVLAGPANSGVAETAAKLAADYDVAAFDTDISDEANVKALMAFTREKYGRLDILDNNAALVGLPGDMDLVNMDVEVWDKVQAVNGRGTMLMCKHAVPFMAETGGGSIINISSGTSLAGDFQSTAYASSKGTVNTLTRYVATQYGALGIRCNALALGLVQTEALDAGMPEPFKAIFKDHKPAGRLGKPADIAAMVAFLASDHSAWLTGQVISVDGGFYAHSPTTVGVAALVQQAQQQ